MRTGRENWYRSAWEREGSGETLVYPFGTQRRLVRKIGTSILAGCLEIRQGLVVLN